MMIKNFKIMGFTIVELMIATLVFSTILLIATSAIINIGNTYYKGALQARTQDTARNIMDEISRGIQFSGVAVVPTSPAYSSTIAGAKYGLCVNGTGYTYITDRQLSITAADLTKQRTKVLLSYPATCSTYTVPDIDNVATVGKELVGLGMRIVALEVRLITTGQYSVTVGVASGERDLFLPNDTALNSTSCKLGAGKQFCAYTLLTTTVQKRVN